MLFSKPDRVHNNWPVLPAGVLPSSHVGLTISAAIPRSTAEPQLARAAIHPVSNIETSIRATGSVSWKQSFHCCLCGTDVTANHLDHAGRCGRSPYLDLLLQSVFAFMGKE